MEKSITKFWPTWLANPEYLNEGRKQAFVEFSPATSLITFPAREWKSARFLDRDVALRYLEEHEDKRGNCTGKNGLFQIDL